MATPLENLDRDLGRLARRWHAAAYAENRELERKTMAAIDALLDRRIVLTGGNRVEAC